MDKLKELTELIVKDSKMNSDNIISHLCEALERCECGEYQIEYRMLYEDAYGKTINKDFAEKWVKSMAITDNSERENGQKWTIEQCYEIGNKLNIDWHDVSKCEWYVVMNMVYSDNYATAKYVEKQNDSLFFGKLAKDWIFDSDSGENKLYNYYFRVICA